MSRGVAPCCTAAVREPAYCAASFLGIEIKDNVQIVQGPTKTSNPNLLYVFVLLKQPGTDEFFTLRFQDLQAHFARAYK